MRTATRMLPLLAPLVAVAALAGCGKKAEPSVPSSTPPESDASDRARLQGLWAIESADDGRKVRGPDDSDIKNDRLRVEGDRFTIISRGDEIKFTFTLDEKQNPRVMTLTEVEDANSVPRPIMTSRGTGRSAPPPAREPEKWEWIYAFEGDVLVVAFSKGDARERPTEFKARAPKFDGNERVAGVSVIKFKKTDVPAPVEPRPRATSRFTTRPGTRK